MVNQAFATVPSGIPGNPVPFTIHIPDEDIAQLKTLVQNTPIPPPSFYNTHSLAKNGPEFMFGGNRDFIVDAADAWVNNFDWRAREKYWNTFPQFTMNVTAPSDGQVFNLHFAALFSSKPDAIPVIASHGWPSSWVEFAPVMELLAAKYTPETLPYHFIAPSIPDFGFSTRDKLLDTEIDLYKAAEALNELMKALGFNAYIAQGGDVGSGLTAVLGAKHDECKAVHFNNFLLRPSEREAVAKQPIAEEEKFSFAIAEVYYYQGTGYMLEQGTKPGTISLALMTNPLALLAWIGGLINEGGGKSIDDTLEMVSWCWYTKSYGRSLWAYRAVWEGMLRDTGSKLPSPLVIKKPLGYSWFRGEVLTSARSWLEHWFPDNLVFFQAHDKGGHFASSDVPETFLKDVEDFVAVIQTKVKF